MMRNIILKLLLLTISIGEVFCDLDASEAQALANVCNAFGPPVAGCKCDNDFVTCVMTPSGKRGFLNRCFLY
jgi:hypothetical protein